VPSPFQAARYHSLVIARSSLPSCLRVTATSDDDGEIMAVEHREHPVVGVQFHPESAATEYGYWILDRFIHGPVKGETARATGADGLDLVRLDEGTPVFVPPAVELVR
jgi:glutamine amidotransferase class I